MSSACQSWNSRDILRSLNVYRFRSPTQVNGSGKSISANSLNVKSDSNYLSKDHQCMYMEIFSYMTSKYREGDDISSKNKNHSFDDPGIVHFGERLKKAMNGESNMAFAKKCGLSDTVIGKYLRGESYPGIDKLPSISMACGRSIEWLLTGKDDSTSEKSLKQNKNNELIEWWQIILKSLSEDELEKAVEAFKEGGKNALLPSAIRSTASKEILRGNTSIPEGSPSASVEPQPRETKKAG